jgi:hypothetical protein
MEVKVDISGYRAEGLAGRFTSAFAEQGKAFMTVATEKILGAAQVNSPVDIAAFKNSLAPSVDRVGSQITGSVGTPISYGSIIEQGRNPGKGLPVVVIPTPPRLNRAGTQIIRQTKTNVLYTSGWIQRKLGLTGWPAIGAAYVIGRKIRERGIPGKFPLKKALEENQAFLKQLFEVDFAAAIAKRL